MVLLYLVPGVRTTLREVAKGSVFKGLFLKLLFKGIYQVQHPGYCDEVVPEVLSLTLPVHCCHLKHL